MKKTITLLFLLSGINIFAQSFVSLEIIPNDPPQTEYTYSSYHVSELSDGNIVFSQSLTSNQYDFDYAIKFIKITPQGKILDSLFYEFGNKTSVDYTTNSLIRNPYEGNSNVYSYFSYGDTCYYHALFFDDDLNVTDEIKKPFYEEGFTHKRVSHFNKNNNFMHIWYDISNKLWRAAETDLYGNLLKSSVLKLSTHLGGFIKWHSFFLYDDELQHYGFIGEPEIEEPDIYIILDENLSVIAEHTLSGYDGYIIRSGGGSEGNVLRLDDNNFALIESFYNSQDHFDDDFLQLCKTDKEFKITDKYIIRYKIPGIYGSTNVLLPANHRGLIRCSDGSIYCIWHEQHSSMPKDLEYYVTRVDKDFNLMWERRFNKTEWPMFYEGVCLLENNGLVLIGDDYSNNDMYATTSIIIFQPDGASTSEHSATVRPYSFYPNPAEDKIHMRISPDMNCEKVEIFGLDGRLYHEQNFNLETVNTEGLSTGIYKMKVQFSNGTSYTEKLIKK